MPIVLKNEGAVPATVRFEALKLEAFSFLGPANATIMSKSYQSFDIQFEPKEPVQEKYVLNFNTLHNPYECHKVQIMGEGYIEHLTFEGLPNGLEDELVFGDCIVNKQKSISFTMNNNSDSIVKFKWIIDKEEFKFIPSIGHMKAKSSKNVKVVFKSENTVKYDGIECQCETS